MQNQCYRVVCLIARACGVNLLAQLLEHPNISVVGVFTHSKKPLNEDPMRSERPEFSQIRKLLMGTDIPLHIVNTPNEARRMEGLENIGAFDFLLSLSWRFIVSPNFLKRSRIADINLHRGLLPKYGGSEPIRRMLEDGLNQATITAHIMEPEIDSGKILYENHLPMCILPKETIMDAVTRIKKDLDPIYPFTALHAMNRILKDKNLPPLIEQQKNS